MTTIPAPLVRTHRYLRLTVVALVVLLAASIAWQTIGSGTLLGSISAYFYTPVRTVFTGALIAVGAAMVAIRGRAGAENAMLTVAGMLAVVVAMVPTPVTGSTRVCGPGLDCVARTNAAISAETANNIGAAVIVGALALIAATIFEYREQPANAPGFGGALAPILVSAWAVWAAVALWAVLGWASFLRWGHLAAAVGLFGLMVAVALVNAVADRPSAGFAEARSPRSPLADAGSARREPARAGRGATDPVAVRPSGAGPAATGSSAMIGNVAGSTLREPAPTSPDASRSARHGTTYRALYWLAAAVMALATLGAAVAEIAGASGHWVIWVEAVLIAAFALFWLVQTIQFWYDGVPAKA